MRNFKKELQNFKYLVLAGDQKCKVVKNGQKKFLMCYENG